MIEVGRRVAGLAWLLALLCPCLAGVLIWLAVLEHRSFSAFVSGNSFVSVVFAVTFPFTGALVASRRPGNAVGWLMIGAPLFASLNSVAQDYAEHALVNSPGSLPGGAFASWIGAWAWVPLVASVPLLLQLLPDGRPLTRRWRWLLHASLAEFTFMLAGFMATWPIRGPRLVGDWDVGQAPALTRIAALSSPILAAVVLGSIASVVVRFIRSRGEERQQLKWITFGVLIVGLNLIVSVNVQTPSILDAAAQLPLAVALPVAILRYRLYDIDLVINKTLVYGVMAGFISAVYVAIVVGVGRLVGSGRDLGLSILATALVAVAFQPVRERVQRVANRVVYGRRASPYEVLSEFSGGMARAVATEELLPRMARVAAEAVGAAGADVWLRVGPDLIREASWPGPAGSARITAEVVGEMEADVALTGADLAVPVRHQGELLGVIGARRSAGEQLSPGEAKLLRDLASQAGLVLRNVRLIEELRTSRQRLVSAQDQERRRLERDLHDGAQQRLVAVSLALRMARATVRPDVDPAVGSRLDQASEQLALALAELREFARGVHPAILTERGLVAGLRSLAERSTVATTVQSGLDRRLPAPVEAAAYFVASEALANVAKYANATSVTVRLDAPDGVLTLDVADDGIGGADPSRGSGLRGLGDRVAAVDGTLDVDSPAGNGTRLTARIPIRTPAAVTR